MCIKCVYPLCSCGIRCSYFSNCFSNQTNVCGKHALLMIVHTTRLCVGGTLVELMVIHTILLYLYQQFMYVEMATRFWQLTPTFCCCSQKKSTSHLFFPSIWSHENFRTNGNYSNHSGSFIFHHQNTTTAENEFCAAKYRIPEWRTTTMPEFGIVSKKDITENDSWIFASQVMMPAQINFEDILMCVQLTIWLVYCNHPAHKKSPLTI